MTENQILLLVWIVGVAGRIPRIVERWKAPLLSGPGWFFGIQVAPDFLTDAGRAILKRYRLRLFLPWAVEIPFSVALLVTGHTLAIFGLVFVITLLTRLNFYANRNAAENAARRFEVSGTKEPTATMALSLQPRTLRAYTNPWIEASIALAVAGSLAWLGYRYAALGDWHPLRGPIAVTLISIYLQIGILLMKRAFVRARSGAPAENAEQYLAWRESLRRLSTAHCDYIRLLLVCPPLIVDLASMTNPWQGSMAQTGTLIFVSTLSAILVWFEWWKRQQHLKVVRTTKSPAFLGRSDSSDVGRLVCFKSSLPMLLLKGPNGYALNLASAPARTAGLYFAGCAALWVFLTR
ncbi:MAG TPA: hypothetical protein VNX18_01830 [Bryobacteraceae bacterium]|nr:hypothetical protein [Bryobacteraceae bacterium]